MTEQKPMVPAKQRTQSALVQAQEHYTMAVQNSLANNINVEMDLEQKSCVMSLVSRMKSLCDKGGLMMKDIDQTNVMEILYNCALLRLNPAAIPHECYIILRNEKHGDNWVKVFEFGVEGDGNDKLLRKYGVGVKNIIGTWLVREHDEFTYPSWEGAKVTPPKWVMHDCTSKVVKVVYVVEYEDGSIQYHISEREGVAVNLKAHIINNTKMDKKLSDQKKEEIRHKLENMSLDQIFADPELLGIMSPAWRDPHSRESMIIRKMRNNATKPIPKDFGNAYDISNAYERTFEDYDQYRDTQTADPADVIDEEVNANAGQETLKSIPQNVSQAVIDVETGEVKEPVTAGPAKNTRPF